MTDDGRKYLPPLDPQRPIANLRRLADAASAIADELHVEVLAARNRGYSWAAIAAALAGRYPSGVPAALGNRFAGGLSETTVRRTYDGGAR